MIFHAFLAGIEYKKRFPASLRRVATLISFGNMGVEVFMLSSGICLYYSWKKDPDLLHYLKKRILRIYKPLLFMGGIMWGYQYLRGSISLVRFLSSLTATRFWYAGDKRIWFISMILVCYFIYPYVYAILYEDGISELNCFLRTALLCAGSVVLIYFLYRGGKDMYDTLEIALTRLPVFFIGCYLGHIVYEKRQIPVWVLPVCLLLMLVCFRVLELKLLTGYMRRYWYSVGAIPMIFLFSWLLQWVPDIIRMVLRFFGSISLELYLSHLTMIVLYKNNLLMYHYRAGSLKRYALTIFISIIFSFVSSKAIEYLGKLGKKTA